MATTEPTHAPDDFPRVDGSISVNEDMEFQHAWWRFERIAWYVLAAVLIVDALGLFGQGWLARSQRNAPDGTLHLRYDRIERAGAPAEMTIEFGPAAVRSGQVGLFSSQTIVKELGAQRIIPEPRTSQVGPGGITYSFPATGAPARVSIALQPIKPGIHQIEVGVPGSQPVRASILVLP
jgi:hypothetical protein